MKKLLLVINEDRFFLSHRAEIAQAAVADGWDVTLVMKDTGRFSEVEALGFKTVNLPVNPTGKNVLEDLRTCLFLYRLYRRNRDAIIHHVGLKSMLWGGVASRFTKPRGTVYAISGLGSMFGESSSRSMSRILLKVLRYGIGRGNVSVIFQNHDDEREFLESDTVSRDSISFIKGSGVDLSLYSKAVRPESPRPLRIIYTGRMLREKGVEDIVKAAELMRARYEGKVEFLLVGGLSGNPSALTEYDMSRLCDGSYIKWLGHREDVCHLLQESDIMCFPSYYREGVPKSLIEASAVGLPLVTTDSIGCRDTVVDGLNGILVPTHSPERISEALTELIDNPEKRRSMGDESRKIAERDYDVRKVVEAHLEIYDRLYRAADR